MGAIHFSLDKDLARLLREALCASVFVETGTFQGDTTAEMQDTFSRIYTAELSEELASRARIRFSDSPSTTVVQGESPQFLLSLKASFCGEPVLYWLDAHWCAGSGTAGEVSQCPLLDELAALKPLNERSAVLIDDARLFLSPPPAPHEISKWPRFDEILSRVREVAPAHEISVLNDVIVVAPSVARLPLQNYAQKNGFDLLQVASDARDKNKLKRCHADAEKYARSLEKACEERLEVIDRQVQRISELESELTALKKPKPLLARIGAVFFPR
ncbi:MAG: hypothetical protein WCO94_00280 [Verrucomicrobiota bacterium]